MTDLLLALAGLVLLGTAGWAVLPHRGRACISGGDVVKLLRRQKERDA